MPTEHIKILGSNKYKLSLFILSMTLWVLHSEISTSQNTVKSNQQNWIIINFTLSIINSPFM